MDHDFVVAFFIKKSKCLKNGEAPIFIRLKLENNRLDFASGQSVHPEMWDSNYFSIPYSCTVTLK